MNKITNINQNSFSLFENNNFTVIRLMTLIAVSVLIISLLRGFIPILLNGLIEAKYIYFTLSGLTLLFALYSMKERSIIPINLHSILWLNLFFGVIWLIVDSMVNGDVFLFFSVCIFPFLMISYCRVPSGIFNKVIFILIPILTIVVFLDYLLINTKLFNNGWEINERLRMLMTSSWADQTHTYYIYRAVGLTGDEHDTSSILVMLSAFLLCIKNNVLTIKYRLLLLIMVYVALMLTASASNVFCGLVTALIIGLYKFRVGSLFPLIKALFIIVIITFILFIFFPSFMDLMLIPFERMSNLDALATMFSTQLELNLANELLSIFLGHTPNLQLSEFGLITEFGILRVLYASGIFFFITIMAVWLMPLLLFIYTDKYTKEQMLPYLAATYAGLFTLIHYGSILRSTNIVLFYSFFGMSIRMYVMSRIFIKSNEIPQA